MTQQPQPLDRQRYVLLGEDGRPKAFYSNEINTVIPQGALPVTDEVYEDLVANQHTRRREGETFTECPPAALAPEILTAGIKTEAARRIAESGHDWMALRKVTAGIDVPEAVIAYAAAVRAASDLLEVEPPQDYWLDAHWPEALS